MTRSGQGMLVLCICVMLLSPASAQIYTWKDKDGRTVISDYPPPDAGGTVQRSGEERLFRSAPQQEAPAQPAPERSAPPTAPAEPQRMRPASDIKVVMYATSWCGYCRKAREYLASLGVSVEEYDVDRQPEQREEMLRKSGGSRGVPLIDIEGIIIRGYSPGAIKAAVEQRMRS